MIQRALIIKGCVSSKCFEQQTTLNSPQAFKAFVNINVVASIPKYALYELNGWGSECKRIHSRSSSGYI